MHWVNVSLHEYPLHSRKQRINNLPVASLVVNNKFHFKIILIPYLEYLLNSLFPATIRKQCSIINYHIQITQAI